MNLFFNLIYLFTICKNFFFQYKNYDVVSASLEYKLFNSKRCRRIDSTFWENEITFWSAYSTNYWVDITRFFKPQIYENLIIEKMPSNVDRFILKVKYFYNGKIYTFISRNNDKYIWPPPSSQQSINFSLPILFASIFDKNGNKIKNITNKVKKCAGPKNNFHNQKIKASDISYYKFKTLQINDILNNTKTYKYGDFIQ